jgi:hypothetical protein
VQLYQNCLCYKTYKIDSEWFSEIFDKINLSESAEQRFVMTTENSPASMAENSPTLVKFF